MSAIADNRAVRETEPSPPQERPGGRSALLPIGVIGLFLGVALGALVLLGSTRDAAPSPYLDAEFTYLGAIETWPAAPGARETGPFGADVSPADQVHAGRTACTRAADPGMSFDGMSDVLGLNPHQTFVVLTEAVDKLCPSQAAAIEALLE